MNAATLVQKLWNYCNVLRDDGMSYGDYVEQLTYLLFLKMADERSRPPIASRASSPRSLHGRRYYRATATSSSITIDTRSKRSATKKERSR